MRPMSTEMRLTLTCAGLRPHISLVCIYAHVDARKLYFYCTRWHFNMRITICISENIRILVRIHPAVPALAAYSWYPPIHSAISCQLCSELMHTHTHM